MSQVNTEEGGVKPGEVKPNSGEVAPVTDPRDVLWNQAFETYYDCYFQEVVADKLAFYWTRVDQIAKFFIAVTASGSAISGWSVWKDPKFSWVFVAITSASAILSIMQTTLGVREQLKLWQEVRLSFASLRIRLKTFHMRMERNPRFDVPQFEADFDKFREEFTAANTKITNDILRTQKLLQVSQEEVNGTLRGETA